MPLEILVIFKNLYSRGDGLAGNNPVDEPQNRQNQPMASPTG